MHFRRTLAVVAVTAVAAAGLVATASQSATALTSDQATTAYDDFVAAYWDPGAQYFYTYSDHQAHAEHAVGPQGGVYTDYWWEAQAWEAVMDRYERAHDTASRQMIDDVYDGWKAAYPDFTANDWNDDMGWWARGSVRAYELTGETRFLTEAETIFDYITQYEDSTYGGGIWWKNVDVGDGTKNEKNVATNATAVWTALRLYDATGDTSYRDTASRIFSWLQTNFYNDGHIRDHVSGTGQFTDYDWTYNFGNYAGAALQMYLTTGNHSYLDQADTAVDWAIDNLTVSGALLNEGTNDTEGFKAILTRNIRALVDDAGQSQYQPFLTFNASQAVNHVSTEGIGGSDWNTPTPSISTTPQQSLGAAATVAIAQQGDPDGSDSIVAGSGVYEAENVDHPGISTEASQAGFTGRGYLAGWNSDGTAATFHVNVPASTTYTVRLHYSAGAGQAVRRLTTNGTGTQNLTFAATPSWADWSTLVVQLPLQAGSNSVSLDLDAASGSTNYLNLDSLTVD